jgi:hypothetical protein
MSSRTPLSNGAREATHLGEIGKTLDVPLGAATLGERLKSYWLGSCFGAAQT